MRQNKLIFDADSHIYSVGRVSVPGVTDIMKKAGLVNDFGTKEDLLRGTYVHKATELYDKGILDESTVDDTIRPYLEGWKKFRAETGFISEEIELRIYSKLLGYAGTLDRIGSFRGIKTLLDIKSGSSFGNAGVQTAGYTELYNEGVPKSEQVKQRMGVVVTKEGKYKMEIFDKRTDRKVFMACLTIRNYKTR